MSLSAKHLRDEKVKVFEALKPIDVRHVVRGQYDGYRSRARGGRGLRHRDHGRGAGRGGQLALARRAVLPALGQVHGRRAPGRDARLPPAAAAACSARTGTTSRAGRCNEIVIDFADPGSITIEFLAKVPGPELSLGHAKMTFSYEDSFATANALEGYERLILLAMLGDQSLFTRSDGIERLWEISTPLLDNPPPVEPYEPGSWGPASVDKLIAPYRWHLPEVLGTWPRQPTLGGGGCPQ